jgi:hypothetical protein
VYAKVTPKVGDGFVCRGNLFLFGDPIPRDPEWMIWGGYDPQAADAQPIPISTVWY